MDLIPCRECKLLAPPDAPLAAHAGGKGSIVALYLHGIASAQQVAIRDLESPVLVQGERIHRAAGDVAPERRALAAPSPLGGERAPLAVEVDRQRRAAAKLHLDRIRPVVRVRTAYRAPDAHIAGDLPRRVDLQRRAFGIRDRYAAPALQRQLHPVITCRRVALRLGQLRRSHFPGCRHGKHPLRQAGG